MNTTKKLLFFSGRVQIEIKPPPPEIEGIVNGMRLGAISVPPTYTVRGQ
jgi:hypothetical protein